METKIKGYICFKLGDHTEDIVYYKKIRINQMCECVNFTTESGDDYILYKIVDFSETFGEAREVEHYYKKASSLSGMVSGYVPVFNIGTIQLF